MATDFKLLEFELYGLLLKAKELLASLPGSGPMADKLDEELERIKTKNTMSPWWGSSAAENPA